MSITKIKQVEIETKFYLDRVVFHSMFNNLIQNPDIVKLGRKDMVHFYYDTNKFFLLENKATAAFYYYIGLGCADKVLQCKIDISTNESEVLFRKEELINMGPSMSDLDFTQYVLNSSILKDKFVNIDNSELKPKIRSIQKRWKYSVYADEIEWYISFDICSLSKPNDLKTIHLYCIEIEQNNSGNSSLIVDIKGFPSLLDSRFCNLKSSVQTKYAIGVEALYV